MKSSGRLFLGGAFALLIASHAVASTLPPFSMSLSDGTVSRNWNSPSSANSDGTINYAGSQNTADWSANWNYNNDLDPAVNGAFSITNTTGSTQTFILSVALPATVGPSSLTGGSVQVGITDNNGGGATLTTFGANPIYMSLIDNANFQPLLSSPQNLTVGSHLSGNLPAAAFGTPIPSFPGPAVASTIGIRLDFTLTAGDSATISSVFVVQPVPEPSTIALAVTGVIGLVGLLRLKRRSA